MIKCFLLHLSSNLPMVSFYQYCRSLVLVLVLVLPILSEWIGC